MQNQEYRETLTFHFGLPKDKARSEQFTRSFYKSMGLKVFSGFWSEIDLNSPQFKQFICEVRKNQISIGADFIGFCFVDQKLIKSEKEYEWYEIQTNDSIWDFVDYYSIENVDLLSIKAFKATQTLNIADGGFGNLYFSERLKNAIEKNRLTGIEFIWMKDTGKFNSSQWFLPVAENPIGKGMDHPWFDPQTLKGSDSFQPISEPFRTGVFQFKNNQMETGIQINSENWRELLDAFSNADLTITSTRKYLRKYLPTTDFAFVWHQEDFVRDGKKLRQRGLCLNNRARKILIDSRLLSANNFVPIELHNEWLFGNVLDEINEYPSPLYTSVEIITANNFLEPERIRLSAKERPLHVTTMKDAIKSLKCAKKNRPEDFSSGTKAYPSEVPLAYQEILRFTNGCCLDIEVALHSTEDLADFNQEKTEQLKEYGDVQGDYFHFGYSPSGDWFSIELAAQNIVRFSHETNEIEYRWSDMALFIQDILSGFYD